MGPERGGPAAETVPQVAEELYALARSGACGMLAVDGNPGGAVYLADGCVTYAESAAVPDLGARLTGSGRLTALQWRLLSGQLRGTAGGVGVLAQRGLISADVLHAVLRSAVMDALIALTVPLAGEPFSARTWFAPRERHWAGSVLRLDIESVRRQVTASASQLAAHGVPPGGRPELSDLTRPWAVLTAGQWQLASGINGRLTVRELAWRHGLALHETAERVAELVSLGLCTVHEHGRVDAAAGAPARLPAGQPGSAPRAPAALPARTPGASMHGPQAAVIPVQRAGRPAPWDASWSAPAHHPDLLHRMLEGLRRLG
ncbi:MAG: hypothetical protein ACLQDY_25885 [Streptosporangiaceae bacterium]